MIDDLFESREPHNQIDPYRDVPKADPCSASPRDNRQPLGRRELHDLGELLRTCWKDDRLWSQIIYGVWDTGLTRQDMVCSDDPSQPPFQALRAHGSLSTLQDALVPHHAERGLKGADRLLEVLIRVRG